MEEKLINAFKRYDQILSSQQFVNSDLDYSILDYHKPFLDRLDVIDSSTIMIFDLYKREHIYVSSKFETVLGYDIDEASEEGTDYFNCYVHPDDLLALTEAGVYFLEMALKMPVQEVKNYKLISEYRMKKANDEWLRVVEQHVCLEFDKHENVWLSLSMLDISPNQDLDSPAQSRLLNFKTGQLFNFPPESLKKEKSPLSKREKQILDLLASGLISKQIADKLYISTNTVNTHRQRIIEKLNVANTAEAVKYSSRIGLVA